MFFILEELALGIHARDDGFGILPVSGPGQLLFKTADR